MEPFTLWMCVFYCVFVLSLIITNIGMFLTSIRIVLYIHNTQIIHFFLFWDKKICLFTFNAKFYESKWMDDLFALNEKRFLRQKRHWKIYHVSHMKYLHLISFHWVSIFVVVVFILGVTCSIEHFWIWTDVVGIMKNYCDKKKRHLRSALYNSLLTYWYTRKPHYNTHVWKEIEMLSNFKEKYQQQ